jgi:hypothetical protein
MMTNLISRLMMTTPLLFGIAAAPALAQSAGGIFDPAQMPATHGVVAQYDLTPRGDVDGLILTDGTEVHVAPYLGPQLLQTVKPGDSVTIHGLRARAIPLVQAMSVTADKTGATIADTSLMGGPPPRRPRPPGGPSVEIHDTVKMQLHGPRGELNGVLLTNGTIVHMPPPAATRLADLLVPGTAIAVTGAAINAGNGQAIAATAIGPEKGTLQPIMMAPPPMGFGPNADAGAPPPPPTAPDAMGAPPAPPPGATAPGTPPQAP